MKLKRIAALLLVPCVILGGCQSAAVSDETENSDNRQAEETETGTQQDGEGQAEADSAASPKGRYEEPVEVSISKVMVTNPHLIEGQSPSDNVVLDLIKEDLNIDVKIAWEAESSEYNNKLSLNIASGDLPDIMYITNYLTFREMADNDMLADLTDIYETYAGDYMKQTYATFGGRNLEPLTIDGKLYALSTANIGYGHNILWLRKDWLDKLGLEVPSTMEELKHVLREFVEKDPGGNGPGNTIGLAIHATKPVAGYGNKFGVEPIFHSLGVYPTQWMKDDAGNVYYGSIAPEMKEGLEILHDMYEEGLIDRQFVTRVGSGETDAIVDSGLAGAWFAPWWGQSGDSYINNPDIELTVSNAPLDGEGKFNHLLPSPTADLVAVSKDCPNPEALLKIINEEYDIYRGIDAEGMAKVQPIFDQGVSREALFPTGGFNLDYYDVVPKLGKLCKNLVETGVMGGDETTTEYDRWKAEGAKRYADGIDPSDPNAPNTFRDYYGRYVGSNILDTPENNPVDAAYYYTTESSDRLKPTLDKLEEQMYLQIITGEKPLEYFDEFVEQWKKLGGDVLTQEVQVMVDGQ